MRSFDAIIIGAGQAGPELAGRLSETGQAGAIIERHLVGGTCVDTLLVGEDRRISPRLPGYALYIDPPLGRVGMTDAQALATGRPLLRAIRAMTRVGRAVEKGEASGFMNLLADAETRRILGTAILGTSGDDAVLGALDMMNADQPIERLRWAVPIHPTVSELIPTLLLDPRPWKGEA